ncbi:MAG TPA: glycoside hydrolase N-terminal domain-containing protein, partial [bacterium]|nr:glycoside hydrolase N-terminal domain-containing protein [bacterium]
MNRYWLLIGIMALPVIPAAAAGPHDFHFPRLADRWDEAVPLGNGMLGALIWQEGSILRFSLDRADLWDNRPVENFQKPEFTFAWMYQKILEKDIQSVQDLIDKPYDRDPAPTRIPAGRLELDQAAFGPVQAVTLDIQQALGTVQWESGVQLQAFVHADRPVGWFRLQGYDKSVVPRLIPPPFSGDEASGNQQANSLSGHTLQSLGYPAPEVINGKDSLTYRQKGWGGFEFVIHCAWRQTDAKTFDGAWAIVSNAREKNPAAVAEREVTRALRRTFSDDLASHARWWKKFWEQSAIAIPDPL